jgi:hypothetical protein
MKKAISLKPGMIRGQAVGLFQTCIMVLKGPAAHTMPDARITGLAVRILDAAKLAAPDNELLGSLEIERGGWPVILSAMSAVMQAL